MVYIGIVVKIIAVVIDSTFAVAKESLPVKKNHAQACVCSWDISQFSFFHLIAACSLQSTQAKRRRLKNWGLSRQSM